MFNKNVRADILPSDLSGTAPPLPPSPPPYHHAVTAWRPLLSAIGATSKVGFSPPSAMAASRKRPPHPYPPPPLLATLAVVILFTLISARELFTELGGGRLGSPGPRRCATLRHASPCSVSRSDEAHGGLTRGPTRRDGPASAPSPTNTHTHTHTHSHDERCRAGARPAEVPLLHA